MLFRKTGAFLCSNYGFFVAWYMVNIFVFSTLYVNDLFANVFCRRAVSQVCEKGVYF